MGQVTITTATDSSSDFQTYQQLHDGRAGGQGGQQVGKLAAYAVGAALSSSVTALLVFYDKTKTATDNPVVDIVEATVAAPSSQRRMNGDGASGYYNCDITLSRGDDHKLDLLGLNKNVELRAGLPGALPGSTTSLILSLTATAVL